MDEQKQNTNPGNSTQQPAAEQSAKMPQEEGGDGKSTLSMPAQSSMGPLIASVIIIVILVIGGFYMWSTKMQSTTDLPPPQPIQTSELPDMPIPPPIPPELPDITPEEVLGQEDPVLESLGTQGTSDELADIEGDLNSTNFDGLDSDLQNF